MQTQSSPRSQTLQQPAVKPGVPWPRPLTRFFPTLAANAAGIDDANSPNLLLGLGIMGSFAGSIAVPASRGRAGVGHGLAQTWTANRSSRARRCNAGGSEARLGAAPRPQTEPLAGEASPPAQLLMGFTPWHGGSWSLRSHSSPEEPPRGAGSSAGTS